MKKGLILILHILASIVCISQDLTITTTKKTGRWSDSLIWVNRKIPSTNSVIFLNHDITIDSPATCYSLNANGKNITVKNNVSINIIGQHRASNDSVYSYKIPALYGIDTLQEYWISDNIKYYFFGKRDISGIISLSSIQIRKVNGGDTVIHQILDDSLRVKVMYQSVGLIRDTSLLKFTYSDSCIFVSRFYVDWQNDSLQLREINAIKKSNFFYALVGSQHSRLNNSHQKVRQAFYQSVGAALAGCLTFGVLMGSTPLIVTLGAIVVTGYLAAEAIESWQEVLDYDSTPPFNEISNFDEFSQTNPILNDSESLGNDLPFVATNEVMCTSTARIQTNATAVIKSEVLHEGNLAVLSRGVCWNTAFNPTIANNKTNDGTGIGSYTSNITGLNSNTTYYVRAYATNNAGTSYGNEVSFTTQPIALPSVITMISSIIKNSSASLEGFLNSDGGAAITEKGFVYSTSPNPTITNTIQKVIVSGSSTGLFESSTQNLAASTKYYIRTYAINSVGTSYGNQVEITTLPANETTCVIVFDWRPYLEDYTGINFNFSGSDINDWYTNKCNGTPQSPTVVARWQYLPQGQSTAGNVSIAYAPCSGKTAVQITKSFSCQSLPTLSTSSANSITLQSATSGGNITNSGGSNITARGVCWSTSPNPTIANSKTTDGNGTGSFSSNITGLSANTLYYARAYATNSSGTAYGNEISFTTASSFVNLTGTTWILTSTGTINCVDNLRYTFASGTQWSQSGNSVTFTEVIASNAGTPTCYRTFTGTLVSAYQMTGSFILTSNPVGTCAAAYPECWGSTFAGNRIF